MADFLTELNWSRTGLNRLFTTQGSAGKIGLGDLLIGLSSGGEVLSTPLTGYVSGAGVITPTDTILSAIEKLNGNTLSNNVTSLNTLTGALSIVAGSGIVVTPSGTNITISNSEAGGSVTSVSVVTANGLAGTVSTPSTTPAITLSTTISGLLQGNGTSISAASTTGSGSVVLSNSPTINSPTVTGGLTTSSLTVGSLNGVLTATSGTVSGSATTTNLPEGSNLYFTQPRVLATPITGYVSGAGTISASDSILSAIEKLNGNTAALTGIYLEINGGNQMMGNLLFSPDNTYTLGSTTANRPSSVNTLAVNVGVGASESGFLNLGDNTKLTQLAAAGGALTLTVNTSNSLYFDGQGNISFNNGSTVASSPFFSFGADGASVLGGYPSPAVHTQYRPGYMAIKNALGIGTNSGEIGALQLGDYTKGNIIYGNADGSMNLWLNNLKMLFIDSSGNWWLDQDVSGATPAIKFTQDDYRSIGATSTTFRPSNVWVAQTVGIGLASGQSGTLKMGVGGAQLVGDTSGNINVTLGASGAVNMNSKKITGLAPGTNPTDAVNFSQLTGGGLSGTTGQVVVFNSSTTGTGYTGFTSDTSGNVVTNTIKSGAGTVSTVGVQVGNTGGTGLYSSAGNVLDFVTNGTSRFQLESSYTLQVPSITSGTGTAGPAATISGSAQTVTSATAAGGALTIQAGSATGTTSTGNGGALTLTAGTSVGGNGGAVTINSGAPQSSSVAGGNGGNINIDGANANGNNTQNNSGGSISITAGTSFGSSAGGTVTVASGTGGIGTGTAGSTGGTTNINGGLGGIGSATSGNGGGATLKAGSGGNGTVGGQGGQAQVVGGTGGTGSSTGGTGGNATLSGGSPGSVAGAAGGTATVQGGVGTSTGTGGAGGAVTISSGAAGGDNTVNNTGGSMTINCGASKGSSGGANVNITAGTGGLGTSTTGANGGTTNINGGNGGVGSATGGAGGNITITGGLGGNSGTPGAGGDVNIAAAATTSATTYLTISHTAAVQVKNAPLNITTTGFGLGIIYGSNCKLGTSVLSGGTVTVSNTTVTANSIIFLTVQSLGTVSVATPIAVTAKSAGVSFTITSASATDTSTVGWMIVEGL